MITIELPWEKPPLRSNMRLKWQPKARLTKQIRTATRLTCQAAKLAPIPGPVFVTLIWTVGDKRIRDSGGSSPTLKAALDGIVDAGVLVADDWTVVRQERCGIEYVKGESGVRIEIEGVEA